MADFPIFPNVATQSNSLSKFSRAFPDPFCDYASTQMPNSMEDVLKWCEHLWLTNGTYRQAAQRVVRYFITKVELEGISDDGEKKKWDDYLEDTLGILDALSILGDDFMSYGNSFSSLYVPFRRYLVCPHCHIETPVERIDYKFEDYTFVGVCPSKKCRRKVKFIRRDRRATEFAKLQIIRWSPHQIKLLHHPMGHKTDYLWEIPGEYKSEIKKGTAWYLESTPWEIIEAVKENKMFRFADNVIFHMCEETIAGVRNRGWGIPRLMSNFKQAWYIQVLKRYNEAIGLDYIVPLRILTPVPGSSSQADPLVHANMSDFNGNLGRMIHEHRKDPTTWQFLPFPVQQLLMGAEGKNLAPVELIDAATDEFLNGMGVPSELYKGTISIQAMPSALRLFERTWTPFTNTMNSWLRWLLKSIADVLMWERVSGRLQPVTLAEDMEKKQIQLQLASGQQISKQTAYAPFGIDYREEVKRMLEEEKFFQEEQTKFQKEQESAATMQEQFMQPAPGMPPEGAAPAAAMQGAGGMVAPMPAGPAGAGVTPEDLTAQAEQVAMQMLGIPYEQRKSELLNIKKSNETLHALVLAKMEKIRGDARRVGQPQALQQMLGQAAGM